MNMEERNLVSSFKELLTGNLSNVAGELTEIGIDTIMEDGVLKEIPFVSVAVSLYNIGKGIKEKHYISKLAVFINEINSCTVRKEKLEKYRNKFSENEQFRNEELEYILILIDRYLTFDKPKMLARLYLSYLDGLIDWMEFTMYAEVIDRFLIEDYETLIKADDSLVIESNTGGESILRLISLGLMTESIDSSKYIIDEKKKYIPTWEDLKALSTRKIYIRTTFGNKLCNILEIKR